MSRKRKHEHGEVLSLYWPDSEDSIYVVGWMERNEAMHRILAARENLSFNPMDIRYRWGRWSCDAFSQEEGLDHCIAIYDAPGPGRFQIMELPL